MDYRRKLIVKPGAKVRLEDFDPGWHGGHADEKAAAAETAEHLRSITVQQRLLYGERRHSLLVVLQGIDAAGKDGVCWHVMQAMNPQGVEVTGFKQPTPEEHDHDFLWRVHPHAPGLGRVAVFNRSHYEDVLVVRVHKLTPKSVWSERYDRINEFERLLTESGTAIVKLFLLISPEEQLKRFGERLDDPMRQWKISDSDYSERALWNDYARAYEAMLENCSTGRAPWYVIPSNEKWFRNLAASQIIAATLSDLGMKLPAPSVDLAAIRAQYHAAEADPSDPEKAARKAKKRKAKAEAAQAAAEAGAQAQAGQTQVGAAQAGAGQEAEDGKAKGGKAKDRKGGKAKDGQAKDGQAPDGQAEGARAAGGPAEGAPAGAGRAGAADAS